MIAALSLFILLRLKFKSFNHEITFVTHPRIELCC
jgi:hypothetical protein